MEWTQDQRAEAFKNRFPSAPGMSLTTMRTFYRKNDISPDLLYKEDYNYANKVYINCDEDPVYLNGKIEEIPENPIENYEKVKKFREDYPRRFLYLTDEMLLYIIHKDVMKM